MAKTSAKHHKPDDIYLKIGSNVRKLRKELGITIEELANSSSINASFVGHIERSHSKPTLYTIEKLAKALNVKITSLFDLESVKNPASEADLINTNVLRILNKKSLTERKKIYNAIKHL
jgi:transcriptional regulator with XRE-family HTH domain